MPVPIHVRGPDGMLRLQVEPDTTLASLAALIKDKTGVPHLVLKCGYPPTDLDMGPSAMQQTVTQLKLPGENLVVVPQTQTSTSPPVAQAKSSPGFKPRGVEPDETVLEWPERDGFIVLRVMPDDNSCMFTAFGGAVNINDPSHTLRQRVVEHIQAHPDKYSDVVLGDAPLRYVSRMMEKDTWGGYIELTILSDIFDIEICSIDVKSLRVDKYGEGKPTRCILLYSGIHYDRIAFAIDLTYPSEVDVVQWNSHDDQVLAQALKLAQKLQNLHYYTDTADFLIKCELCDWIGHGARQASAHEKETGHQNFGEMRS